MEIGEFQRVTESPIHYPVQCNSLLELLKQLLKAVRDILRIYKKRYPHEISTAALYSIRSSS